MDAVLPTLREFWQIWLMLLFVGIVVRTLWPGRRQEMEANARIPFRDEETTDGRQG